MKAAYLLLTAAALAAMLASSPASAAKKKDAGVAYNETDEVALLNKTAFTRGDASVVYLHLSHTDNVTGDTVTSKAKFYPFVDDFSLLAMLDTSAYRTDPTATIYVEYYGFTSEVKHFSDGNGRFVGSWSIVANFTKGTLDGIHFDGNCKECNDTCLDDTCTLLDDPATCEDVAHDPNKCGIKVYMAFYGTDTKDRDMSSTDSLPSKFTQYSGTNVWEAAAGVWTDFVSFWHWW
eukprot:TRINITY_DN974_c0_g1_i3.p1 TRINITY_DN974_c0_g1~~TRINITY_DN974_c0_g1_i3.p1  ORF type:complete len:234 (-),score=71.65 TRINITY_DN974_c0_g1_i3:143-844(-)